MHGIDGAFTFFFPFNDATAISALSTVHTHHENMLIHLMTLHLVLLDGQRTLPTPTAHHDKYRDRRMVLRGQKHASNPARTRRVDAVSRMRRLFRSAMLFLKLLPRRYAHLMHGCLERQCTIGVGTNHLPFHPGDLEV